MALRNIETEFGPFSIRVENNAVTALYFEHKTEDNSEHELCQQAEIELREYLNGERKTFQVALKPDGTDFQKSVWQTLLEIPFGQTATYKDIALKIGNDKASRAVGMANNKNPLPIFIPCHRVIGANGSLVGYAGGIGLKERLLKLEN